MEKKGTYESRVESYLEVSIYVTKVKTSCQHKSKDRKRRYSKDNNLSRCAIISQLLCAN